MSNVLSRPQSVSEKAGFPITVIQRSQLGTPPKSAQPVGNRNMYPAAKATIPTAVDATLRVRLSMAVSLFEGRARDM